METLRGGSRLSEFRWKGEKVFGSHFKCKICGWKSEKFYPKLFYEPLHTSKMDTSLIEHFWSEHPEIESKNISEYLEFMNDTTNTSIHGSKESANE